jgi:hypothetical protein
MRKLVVVVALALVAVAAAQDSLNCRLVGTYELPAFPIDVAVPDSLTYIAAADGGLHIISIANPQSPSEVGLFGGMGTAMGVAVKDSIAYVAAHSSGLFLLSVGDPTNPYQVGQRGTLGVSARVALRDTLAFVADRSAGLSIVSVADPAHPYDVGSYLDTLGSIHNDVAVAGDFAYAATVSADLLQVINVADPANPTLAGSCAMPSYAEGITVSGGYAYVAAGDMVIVDVSNPQNPQEVGRYVSPGFAMDVRVMGNTAYVADGNSGLRVVDVSNPQQPQGIGFYDTPGYANGVALAGDYVCVTEDPIGLRVFQFYGAGVEETPNGEVRTPNRATTVVCGTLFLPPALITHRSSLITSDGREVLDLKPGVNDVSRLAPGVYFVHSSLANLPSSIEKVIVTR